MNTIAQEVAAPLTFVINMVHRTGICPVEFKLAMVTPILNGDQLQAGVDYLNS